MGQLHVDQTVKLSMQAVDVFGNLVDANFENTQWLNSDETAATMEIFPSENASVLTPLPNAVGKSTTVNVSTQIGGTLFTAQITESIVAGAVAGVMLMETFAPKPAALAAAKNKPPN